ncbi:MAG: riboflavin biosynthesis protein RibF [Prevotella sp.]|nr:riboflavin biosynthesis protein RibF [Prevotella sp.]
MTATIGFFDGVHQGHQFVIRHVADEAHRRGMEAVVVTFDRPPREVVTGQSTPLLTTLEEKKALILAAGADRCEVLPFTREMAMLTAKEFMQTILKEQLQVEVLMLGYDNRFGHRTPGVCEDFNDYQRYARELSMEVVKLPQFNPQPSPTTHQPSTINHQNSTLNPQNSTFIRNAVKTGDVALAALLLGRRYSITGRVVHGRGEGRKLNFPTANPAPQTVETIIPATGVYEVAVKGPRVQEFRSENSSLPGIMNIGTRPTYGNGELSLEVHLLNFSGNLYNHRLTVEFLRRIRPEQTFSSPEALRQQIEKDRSSVMERNVNKEK